MSLVTEKVHAPISSYKGEAIISEYTQTAGLLTGIHIHQCRNTMCFSLIVCHSMLKHPKEVTVVKDDCTQCHFLSLFYFYC